MHSFESKKPPPVTNRGFNFLIIVPAVNAAVSATFASSRFIGFDLTERFDYAKSREESIGRWYWRCFSISLRGEDLALSLCWGGRSESKTCVQLNLTPRTDGSENSADVAGEITGYVFEHRVSIPSQRKRALRVARDCQIRPIEQIVSFRAKRKLRALRQMEVLLYRDIKLREGG